MIRFRGHHVASRCPTPEVYLGRPYLNCLRSESLCNVWAQQKERERADKARHLLVEQAARSALDVYEIAHRHFGIRESQIRYIELLYFSLTTVSLFFLRTYKHPNKTSILDGAALDSIHRTVLDVGASKNVYRCIEEYQERYWQYEGFLVLIFGQKPEALLTLTQQIYARAIGRDITDWMGSGDHPDEPEDIFERAINVSPLVMQFIMEQNDFCRRLP